MKTIICDVCKHAIQQPVAGQNYFHIGHRELCEPCNDQLEFFIKPVVRTKQPFNYEWFDRLIQDSIEQAIERGRFDFR
ncbi:hypothetical protein FACS189468_7710 [Spirochaetia bacterium]|nr:hypothetical protein FACS189468_7710 [Spirochaetia bacterium]